MSVIDRVKAYPKGSEQMRDSFSYNEGVRAAWTPIWVRNSHRSYQEIERRFQLGNYDLASLKPRMKGGPCLILGSGPSLEDVKPYLKDWQGDIFCSTSHLPMLKYMGIDREGIYCSLIDCDPAMIFLVTDYVSKDTKITLLTHPQAPREIIQHWPDDKVFFFRMLDPSDDYSNKFLPLAYGWLNEKANWSIGTTILNGGNIVNTMLPMCHSFGYSPVYLCGYDLGYPDNKRRCSDYRLENGEWKIIPAPELTEQRWVEAVRLVSNNGVPFDELGGFYKTSSIIMWGMACPPVLSCSRGVMTEWPYVHPRQVVEKQGLGFEHLITDPVTAYKAASIWLRRRGFMILKTDYWASVQNLAGMKWYDKIKHLAQWHWYKDKPWKWMGGKGYMPHNIKKSQKNAKAAQKKAEACTTIATGTVEGGKLV